MPITFKQIDEENVIILKDGKKVGQIFTPSGTMEDMPNSIQICGFSEAFDYWACGPYNMFKDIQLYFGNTTFINGQNSDLSSCGKCFRKPCECKNNFEVKRTENIKEIIKKEMLGKMNKETKEVIRNKK